MKIKHLVILIAITLMSSCNVENSKPKDNHRSDTVITKTQIDSAASVVEYQEDSYKDTLPEKNLCDAFEKSFFKEFLLPIHSGNIGYLFNTIKLDSKSLNNLKKANVIPIKECEQFPTINDMENFLEDLSNSKIFDICIWNSFQNHYTSSGFFILETTELPYARCYLITYKLKNQKEDFIEPVDAVLISYGLYGSKEEDYRRETIFYDLNKIRISESCYKYKSMNLQNEYNVSIDKNSKITLTLLKKTNNKNN